MPTWARLCVRHGCRLTNVSGRLQGYTIPLDKRLAADGRGLQEVQINDQFAKLTEALYVAESKAREAVDMRQKVRFDLHVHTSHALMPTFAQSWQPTLRTCRRSACDRARTVDFVGGSSPVEGVPFSTDMRACGSMQSYHAQVVHGRCHRQGRTYVVLQSKSSAKQRSESATDVTLPVSLCMCCRSGGCGRRKPRRRSCVTWQVVRIATERAISNKMFSPRLAGGGRTGAGGGAACPARLPSIVCNRNSN